MAKRIPKDQIEVSARDVLRRVRRILRVPEGASVCDHATNIMNNLEKATSRLEDIRGEAGAMLALIDAIPLGPRQYKKWPEAPKGFRAHVARWR